jgi:hypothetical protein
VSFVVTAARAGLSVLDAHFLCSLFDAFEVLLPSTRTSHAKITPIYSLGINLPIRCQSGQVNAQLVIHT